MFNSDKYPRTPHLPWSPGGTSDDKRLSSIDNFVGKELLITEKMDGSNVCLTSTNVFARSHSGVPSHASFDLLKAQHAQIKHKIDAGLSVFGEWIYAVHSINYTKLPSYFMIFGVRDDETGEWYSWDLVEELAKDLGFPTVPVLFRGYTSDLEQLTTDLSKNPSTCGPEKEGVVVRILGALEEHTFNMAKYVRKNHVQTDDHWMHKEITKNLLDNG